MTALRHPDWHIFAEQRFRRRGAVGLVHQSFRGEACIVLDCRLTGQYLRLSQGARHLWDRLDGQRTGQDIWEEFMRDPATAPSQNDLVSWLLQLVSYGFVLSDHGLDPNTLTHRHDQRRGAALEQRAASPLAIKLRLFDPDPLVRAAWPLFRHLFTAWGAGAMAVVVLTAAVLAARNAEALLSGADAVLLSQSGLAGLALVYPAMKALHELAHCLTLYRYGGRVREFGVMLLVLFPVPYVDASETLALPDKRARMMVSAAGIVAELVIASVALFLWLLMEPGVERAVLFNIMVIGSVSTLLFNGNPLLKFDAYYVLADWLEMPNLATRAGDYLVEGFRTRILGLRPETASVPGEGPILATYGVLALGYRLVLTVTISLLVSGWFFVVGLALGLWSLVTGLVWPLLRTLGKGARSARDQNRMARAGLRGALALAVVLGALTLVPLPFAAHGTGRVVPQSGAQVVAGTSGLVDGPVLADAAPVARDATLMTLSDRATDARLAALRTTLSYLDEALLRSGLSPLDRRMMEREHDVAQSRLQELQTRAAQARIAAPVAGRLVWAKGAVPVHGSYVFRGQVLGHVAAPGTLEVVAALPAALSGLGQGRLHSLRVRLPDGTGMDLPILRDQVVDVGGVIPAELLTSAGGPVPENPENPGRALDAVWIVWAGQAVDLQAYAGQRVQARLDLGQASAAWQMSLYLQRLFLRALRL